MLEVTFGVQTSIHCSKEKGEEKQKLLHSVLAMFQFLSMGVINTRVSIVMIYCEPCFSLF